MSSSCSSSVDVIDDLIETFQKNKIYNQYKVLLDKLNNFDCQGECVNFYAFEGCFRDTICYCIDDFQFEYTQLISSEIILSASFKINNDLVFGTDCFNNDYFNPNSLQSFKKYFKLNEDDTYYYKFFNILNVFTIDDCMGFYNQHHKNSNDEYKNYLDVIHLDDLISF